MRKAYLIGPLVGLILFGVVYWQFIGGYQAKQEAAVAALEQAKLAKQREELKAREVAVEEAKKLQEERKKERAAKEEKDRREKEALLAARDAREKALRDQDKFEKQVKRLTEELETENAALAKLAEQQKFHRDEQAFLKDFVTQAQGNVKNLLGVLDKIAAADAAAAKAAQLAATKKSD